MENIVFAYFPPYFKTSHRTAEAIEAQIRDEIAIMQRIMICGLRQYEHLVSFDALLHG
jgi:hypothetical protein